MHDLWRLSLSQGSSDNTFHLKGKRTLYVDVKEESKNVVERTQLPVVTQCLGSGMAGFVVGRVHQE